MKYLCEGYQCVRERACDKEKKKRMKYNELCDGYQCVRERKRERVCVCERERERD